MYAHFLYCNSHGNPLADGVNNFLTIVKYFKGIAFYKLDALAFLRLIINVLIVKIVVEIVNLCLVAIHSRRVQPISRKSFDIVALRCLRPPSVRHQRVDVGVKAILRGVLLVPKVATVLWAIRQECDLFNGCKCSRL